MQLVLNLRGTCGYLFKTCGGIHSSGAFDIESYDKIPTPQPEKGETSILWCTRVSFLAWQEEFGYTQFFS